MTSRARTKRLPSSAPCVQPSVRKDSRQIGLRSSTGLTCDNAPMFAPLHPFDTLRVLSRSVTLAFPDRHLVEKLAELACEPIHDAGYMPFQNHWSNAPGDVRSERMREHVATAKAESTPDNWSLPLAVLNENREVVGCQSLTARGYGLLGTVNTGSWLALRHQGKGYGTLMRRAALALAFTGLLAGKAQTVARVDNHASLRVTEKLGYRKVATGSHVYLDEEVATVGYELTRSQWPDSPGYLNPVLVGAARVCDHLGIELPSRDKPRPRKHAIVPHLRAGALPKGLDNPR